MKIAIVTTDYANNDGTLLQSRAMQKFLNHNMKYAELI